MQTPANIIIKHIKYVYHLLKILFYISTEKFVVYKIQQLDRLNVYSKHTKPGIF